MSVFKYHAFIYFLRPPPWYGTIPLLTNFRGQKSRATVPLKPLKSKKHLVVKNIISSYFRPKYAENCGSEALKLRTWSFGFQKKLQLRNCGVAVAEQHCFKKLRNCNCGSASFKLQNYDCRLKKSCACLPLLMCTKMKNNKTNKSVQVICFSSELWSVCNIITY